jgi:hypothetical protein
MKPRTVLLVGALVVGVLLACKKKEAASSSSAPDPAASAAAAKRAEERAQVAARVDAIKKIADAMKAAPRIKSDGAKLEPGGIQLTVTYKTRDGENAALIFEEDLADPEHSKTGGEVVLLGRLVETCADLAAGRDSVKEADVPAVVKKCLGLKYALVLRTTKKVKPSVKPDKSAFVSGEHTGEVHVFLIEGAKRLGGFRFAAENSDKVDFLGPNPDYALENDMRDQLEAAILAKVDELGK